MGRNSYNALKIENNSMVEREKNVKGQILAWLFVIVFFVSIGIMTAGFIVACMKILVRYGVL